MHYSPCAARRRGAAGTGYSAAERWRARGVDVKVPRYGGGMCGLRGAYGSGIGDFKSGRCARGHNLPRTTRHAPENGDDAVSKRGAEANTREARRTGRTRAKSEQLAALGPCGACQGAERQERGILRRRGRASGGDVRVPRCGGGTCGLRGAYESGIGDFKSGRRARGHKLPRTTAARSRGW